MSSSFKPSNTTRNLAKVCTNGGGFMEKAAVRGGRYAANSASTRWLSTQTRSERSHSCNDTFVSCSMTLAEPQLTRGTAWVLTDPIWRSLWLQWRTWSNWNNVHSSPNSSPDDVSTNRLPSLDSHLTRKNLLIQPILPDESMKSGRLSAVFSAAFEI